MLVVFGEKLRGRKSTSKYTTPVVIESEEDEHIWITIRSSNMDRPTISLDITNDHGRRGLSVRVNGFAVLGMLLDVKELPPSSGKELFRFCQFCGEEIQLISSKSHVCKPDIQ